MKNLNFLQLQNKEDIYIRVSTKPSYYHHHVLLFCDESSAILFNMKIFKKVYSVRWFLLSVVDEITLYELTSDQNKFSLKMWHVTHFVASLCILLLDLDSILIEVIFIRLTLWEGRYTHRSRGSHHQQIITFSTFLNLIL